MGVVDGLEAVEVHQCQATLLAVAAAAQLPGDLLPESTAIQQAGEGSTCARWRRR